VGRWSRLVAAEFVAGLEVAGGAAWLDLGCGTGALSQAVLETADPALVVAADARRLPVGDARFEAVVSGLVLNFVPDPALAVREMARVVRPGGRVAAYVWDYAGRMELIRHFWDA